MDTIASFIDYTSTWFLKQYRAENLKDNNLVKIGEKYKSSITKIMKSMPAILPESTKQLISQREEKFTSLGLPKDIASRIAMLPILNTSCDIVKIAEQEKQDISTVAKVYFGLSENFAFVWLRDQARQMPPKSRWEADTLRGLVDRFYTIQTELTKRIIRESCVTQKCPLNPVDDWITTNGNAVNSVLEAIGRLSKESSMDFAMLTSIEMRLQQLI
jgi:glutamate dehydrogenase